MVKYFFYAILFLVSTTTQCSKTTVDPNGLPPETQTGAGTFACKINGVVWRYKDPNYEVLGTKPKTRWEYDPTLFGGLLYISGVRYFDGINLDDILNITIDSINTKTKFSVGTSSYWGLKYNNYKALKTSCQEISSDSFFTNSKNYYSSGNLAITKFDKSTKIISGTFYCTIYQTGCDTLKITEGRFDLKYQ